MSFKEIIEGYYGMVNLHHFLEGLVWEANVFGLYTKGNGKPLEVFEQGISVFRQINFCL